MKTFVDYILPSYEDLKKRFPMLSAWVYADMQKFCTTPRCMLVVKNPREVVFTYYDLMFDMSLKDTLLDLRSAKLRPAIDLELIAFDKEFTDEVLDGPILAVGSMSPPTGGNSYFLQVIMEKKNRCLQMHHVVRQIKRTQRVLAVRES